MRKIDLFENVQIVSIKNISDLICLQLGARVKLVPQNYLVNNFFY